MTCFFILISVILILVIGLYFVLLSMCVFLNFFTTSCTLCRILIKVACEMSVCNVLHNLFCSLLVSNDYGDKVCWEWL